MALEYRFDVPRAGEVEYGGPHLGWQIDGVVELGVVDEKPPDLRVVANPTAVEHPDERREFPRALLLLENPLSLVREGQDDEDEIYPDEEEKDREEILYIHIHLMALFFRRFPTTPSTSDIMYGFLM